jgi:hypothetical protein
MSTTQNAVIKASISVFAKKGLDGRDVIDRIPDLADIVLSYGAGYGKADISFSDDRALSASTSENLDMAGALTDAFGQTINAAAKVKAIMIDNLESSVGTLTIGGAASNTFNGPFSGATFTRSTSSPATARCSRAAPAGRSPPRPAICSRWPAARLAPRIITSPWSRSSA